MMQQFVKYQSFGNDFILLDFINQSNESIEGIIHNAHWSSRIAQWCDRHRGIGADGVLILKKNSEDVHEMHVFNADGSSAEICLNGMRCCVRHLYLQNPGKQVFQIQSVKQVVRNQVDRSQGPFHIITNVPFVRYERMVTIATQEGDFTGHCVDVGNPHFIVFAEKEVGWLSEYGSLIEKHPLFPRKTNVAFVWQESQDEFQRRFRVLFYERGCGMTLACSSGAAAVIKALYQLGTIKKEECIRLAMQGGILQCMMEPQEDIVLMGDAHRVFSGTLEN